MQNPNDPTAAYYEAANQYFKNDEVLSQELDLIKSYCTKDDQILDIGCGTGRHLLPLMKAGYSISGIDSSSGMLTKITDKAPTAKVKCADFLTADYKKAQFDICLMFWNTFNEIALTEGKANELIKKCSYICKDGAKIIINIDDASVIDPEHLDFQSEIYLPQSFTYDWHVLSFDRETNTTISQESIVFPDRTISTEITQRWWQAEQINKFALKNNYKMEVKHIKCNNELYIILTKVGK